MAEAAGLLGQHVDLDEKTIVLTRGKTRSAFSIPVFPQVEHLLQRLHEQGRLFTVNRSSESAIPKRRWQPRVSDWGYPHTQLALYAAASSGEPSNWA